MAKETLTGRLSVQQKDSGGVFGIFGNEAKTFDAAVGSVSRIVIERLKELFPKLTFRFRPSISKEEINTALRRMDSELGQTLFVPHSSIISDGGIVEVRDDRGLWRVILVSEAKYQGKDIENIK